MAREKRLEGKVALITGGVRRIGKAIALALAEEGAAIVVNARRSREEADTLAAEIEAGGGQALVHLADVTDEAAVAAMFAAVEARFGRLDILVNNAAIRKQTPLVDMAFADWREVTAIILDGAFLCTRAAVPLMLRGGGGALINIGGMTGHTGAFDRAHVVTAKAGLVGFTKAVATEYAAQGITANCVVPGKIGGQRSATSGESATVAGHGGPLVGREGRAEEVAEVVRMLCVPTGRFITGQSIHVSGGLFMP